jgi:hypothetical protein
MLPRFLAWPRGAAASTRGAPPAQRRGKLPRPARGVSGAPPCACGVWRREPDAWDLLVEQEEAARRATQSPADSAQQAALARAAAERAEERAAADALHARLLERQQRREALRDRLWEDARRAKREALQTIEVRARG